MKKTDASIGVLNISPGERDVFDSNGKEIRVYLSLLRSRCLGSSHNASCPHQLAGGESVA